MFYTAIYRDPRTEDKDVVAILSGTKETVLAPLMGQGDSKLFDLLTDIVTDGHRPVVEVAEFETAAAADLFAQQAKEKLGFKSRED